MQTLFLNFSISVAFSVSLLLCFSTPVHAQAEVFEKLQETVPATVEAITGTETRVIPGTDTSITTQTITVKILEGAKADTFATFENEFAPLRVGQRVFINRIVNMQGDESIILMDIDRRRELFILGLLAFGLIIFFAGWQGLRALFSLALSVGAIIFLLVPALLAGYDPALASFAIAGLILAVVLFITHGVNARSLAAFVGTYSAVLVTCIIAAISVRMLSLSGFSSDEAVFLNFATSGALDFSGLLLGSIIIGILGVLDDVAITQASVVQELKAANNALRLRDLYARAINVGRDHVGSLVNTLALAYVGVSLPLILLFARADSSLAITINQEIIAAEIVRIIIGSIGLVLAVPLTTVVAAWYFGKQDQVTSGGHAHHHH